MIEGKRTRLRPIEPADADLLLRWQSDSAVMRWWGLPAPLYTRAELERDAADRLRQRESAIVLLIETMEGKPIGRLDVDQIDPRHRSAVVGLYVGETAVQGKGLGSDALAAACRYLFDQRALHRIALTVMIDNARARALYERLGFRREGTLRGCVWMDGEPIDTLAMSLLAGELREIV